MLKLTKLKLENIDISPDVVDFLNPEFIYLPIYNNYKILVKDKQQVGKAEVVLLGKDNNTIASPISGTIVGITNKYRLNNELIKALVISNNYKEEVKTKNPALKDLKKLSKDEFIEALNTMGVLSDNNDQELLKEKFTKIDKPICIVLKCFDDEPFIENSRFILKDYMENILFTLDSLLTIFDSSEGLILLKEKNSDIISQYKDFLGTFPKINIKLIEDLYPLSEDKLLKEKIFKLQKNKDNKVLVLSLQNILNIYNAVKRKRQIIEKYITITGNAIEKPMVVKVKIGTKVIDLLEKCTKLTHPKVTYIANGLLKGNVVENINELIITNDFNGIIINRETNTKPIKCINCGKCYKICPMHIDPKNIDKSKCINCGLCRFICPSKIDLLKDGGAKNAK